MLAGNTKPQQVQPKLNPSSKTVKELTIQTTTITGTQIKNARKVKGWSQGQLAGFLGVSQNLVSLIERDKRSINKKLKTKIGKLLEI